MKNLILILFLNLFIGCNSIEYIILRYPDGRYVSSYTYIPYSSSYTGSKLFAKRFMYYKNAFKAVDVIRENEEGKYKYQIIEVKSNPLLKYIR